MCAAEVRRAPRRLAAGVVLGATLLALAGVAVERPRAATPTKSKGQLAIRAAQPVAEDRWPRRRRVYPADLPPGPGQEIAARACMICHSGTLVTQQRKDAAAWDRTITTMMNWGAPVTPEEVPALRAYLAARFGPRR